jgi:two-component system NarL family response regulator
MGKRLRILLVDDHALMRLGLATVIAGEPDMEVCGQAGTGNQAVALFRAARPDVTLMDMRLPDRSGAEAIRTIRQEFPDARILVISTFAADEEVYTAITAGALGYVLKTVESEELVEVIRRTAQGQRYIPPEVGARLADRIPLSDLTARERLVLTLLVRGRRNRQIAEELGISEGTVKSHVSNIMLKLGVSDRTEAATVAIERGLVHLG